ncbi:hypothetical protein EUX98_g2012 [Antrodiella citrinella]|uniref:Uncharacterized protein n=1 Tax=Antrodiella citrinella TaxID=2447956 RepID=A0A4S4N322_9APHY|nr:hypothetical protein EUX98_g2012 [Antrodiella citrinella]
MFFGHSLQAIRISSKKRGSKLPDDWSSGPMIQSLVHGSRGLSVWASTACKFIDAEDPQARLSLVLRGVTVNCLQDLSCERDKGLFVLYSTILKEVGRKPLNLSVLNLLASDTEAVAPVDAFHDIIQHFSCFFTGWGSDPEDPNVKRHIRIRHRSLFKFLTKPWRCGYDSQWFIDVHEHKLRLGLRCLDLLEQAFTPSGTAWDRHPDAVRHAIITYWMNHFCESGDAYDDELEVEMARVKRFLSSDCSVDAWLQARREIMLDSSPELFPDLFPALFSPLAKLVQWLHDSRTPLNATQPFLEFADVPWNLRRLRVFALLKTVDWQDVWLVLEKEMKNLLRRLRASPEQPLEDGLLIGLNHGCLEHDYWDEQHPQVRPFPVYSYVSDRELTQHDS